MMKDICFSCFFSQLRIISSRSWYWWSYIAGSIVSLAIALYHQHGLDEQPCLMCIQVRLLFTLLIFIAVIGLFSMRNRLINALANVATVAVFAALTERSYMLLGTERGFVFSDCGFNLGLPAWFAIDEWLPSLYRVETTCGYTPEVMFGITMAEALMVLSVVLLVISSCVTLVLFAYLIKKD